MRRWVAAVLTALVLFAPSVAEAHVPDYVKCSDESPWNEHYNDHKDCRKVGIVVHKRFKSNDRAHKALSVGGCESGLDKFARNGEHWGIWQVSKNLREQYGWRWWVWHQVRMVWRIVQDYGGWGPWEGGVCA